MRQKICRQLASYVHRTEIELFQVQILVLKKEIFRSNFAWSIRQSTENFTSLETVNMSEFLKRA